MWLPRYTSEISAAFVASYYCQNQQIKEISFTGFPLWETRMCMSFDSDFSLYVHN